MADDTDNRNKLFDVQLPPILQLENEITGLENEFSTKLKALQAKWHVRVSGVEYDGQEFLIHCAIRNSRVERR